MELQQNLDAIRKQGLGVAAISYDSTGVLKSFANRQHIAYPLLSDPDSKIIRAFDILNETAKSGTLTYGIPYPGVYIVDVQGKVTGTFGGALEARQIGASAGRLVGEAVGEIELEENVLVISCVHVRMRLKTEEENRETATRVHGIQGPC